MQTYKLFPYEVQEVKPESTAWNVLAVNAPSFWVAGGKGSGAVVAIIDTGLDVNHAEFKGRVINPRNFTAIEGHLDVTDTEGHGTHVAGTIAGATVGIGPGLRIMPLKVFGDSKVNQNITDAFIYISEYNKTAPEQDKVVAVNCSFGGPYDPFTHNIIRQLVLSGVAVCVAAGNQGDGNPDTEEMFSYPGYLWEVITTGALNKDGRPAGYSSSYDGIDIAAPGTEVYSAWPGGKYALLSGTSMATPHITAACALIISHFRRREGRRPTMEELESILFKHIRKVSQDPAFVGNGVLDLTFSYSRWPLHRVQLGAFYNPDGAKTVEAQAKAAHFNPYIVKY